ncbi:MAG: hypothetical protein DRJ42_19240 [Deltaproteobacteria bacterium]|nr:MAG: hypothetical protein DRJ42_19240 [Deltaproteobacteria bacterium]
MISVVMDPGADFAELLFGLAESRHSGIIETIGEDGVRTDLFLRRGEVIFVEQGTLGETLGRLLQREGLLSQDEYAQVINRMTEKLIDTEQLRFGEAAVELGFVSGAQIHKALALQVRRKAVRCLASAQVECTLRDDPEALDAVTAFPISIAHCVLEAVRLHFTEQRLSHVLFDVADQCPVVTRETRDFLSGLPLLPAEHRLIAKLPRDRSMLSMLRVAKDPLALKRLLAFLRMAGVLELVSPTNQSAGEQVVTRVSVKRRPSVPATPAAAATAAASEVPAPQRASSLAAQISRAVGRSAPPPKNEKRARLEAEQAFERGRAHSKKAKWDSALDAFRRAALCMPDAVEYELYGAWAAVMTAEDGEARKERVREAAIAARRARKQEPEMAYAYYVEGNVALEVGREDAALRRFRHAAKLDPDFTDAVRLARILQRRMEK